jgi:hypothetical protein
MLVEYRAWSRGRQKFNGVWEVLKYGRTEPKIALDVYGSLVRQYGAREDASRAI